VNLSFNIPRLHFSVGGMSFTWLKGLLELSGSTCCPLIRLPRFAGCVCAPKLAQRGLEDLVAEPFFSIPR
jgi:hypothetical protein